MKTLLVACLLMLAIGSAAEAQTDRPPPQPDYWTKPGKHIICQRRYGAQLLDVPGARQSMGDMNFMATFANAGCAEVNRRLHVFVYAVGRFTAVIRIVWSEGEYGYPGYLYIVNSALADKDGKTLTWPLVFQDQ